MSAIRATQIELKLREGHLEITSPYDEDLVAQIKSLPWKQRKWENGKWKILSQDPEQNPEQETNLDFIRRICTDCCNRRGWQFADYTHRSPTAIAAEREKNEADLLEAHVAAMLEVLPQLPPYSLKLSRWNQKVLKLQLARYLSEDEAGQGLWRALYQAAVTAWKPCLTAPGLDRKMGFGFVFEVAADDRIIQALMGCQGVEFLKVHRLQTVQLFPDGVGHFKDEGGNCFVGIDYKRADMSEQDFDSSSWEVAQVDDAIYWVAERGRYIDGWLGQSGHSVVGCGGAFGVFLPLQPQLIDILKLFHLEEWFKSWAQTLLKSDELLPENKYYSSLWRESNYKHPADLLLDHFVRFKYSYTEQDLSDLLGQPSVTKEFERVKAQKAIAASRAREESRRNAASLAQPILENHSKDELIEMARTYQLTVRKSWKKEAIVAALMECQALCEKAIGLKIIQP